jgi:MFS family permease
MTTLESRAAADRRRHWLRRDRARAVGGDVWLLTGGTFASSAGDAAAMIALLLRLRPDGAVWIAGLLGAELVPSVIASHWTGRLVDSHDKRRLLILALCGQAVVSVPLALFNRPWLTVTLFFLLAALGTLVRPATSALIPALSGEERKLSGYAWISTGSSLGLIIGPALGGLLTGAFGARSALLGEAGTFVALTMACIALKVREAPRTQRLEKGRGTGGLSLIHSDLVLRTSILITAVADRVRGRRQRRRAVQVHQPAGHHVVRVRPIPRLVGCRGADRGTTGAGRIQRRPCSFDRMFFRSETLGARSVSPGSGWHRG